MCHGKFINNDVQVTMTFKSYFTTQKLLFDLKAMEQVTFTIVRRIFADKIQSFQ